jgi:UDP:flavonoid glycosyltransferase YjiC (YdhE family)
MTFPLRLHIAQKLLDWSRRLEPRPKADELDRTGRTILIFFHGDSLAHTLRPLVVARALHERGYNVLFAGRGVHSDRIRQEDFNIYDVESMPQSRMDEYVERGDYAYYSMDWIHRCVVAERELMRKVSPDLVIYDMRPTIFLSARLEGIDDARITQGYNHPLYTEPIHLSEGFNIEAGPFDEYLAQYAQSVKKQRSFFLLADAPEFHPAKKESGGYYYVGPLLDEPTPPKSIEVLDEGWDTSLPLIYLTCGSSGRDPDYLEQLLEHARELPYRILVTTAGRWDGIAPSDNVRVVDFVAGEWVLQRASALVGILGIGAIYQALRCGVPVIGGPEHLDQEYHLNRVRDMGVGVKLDRRDFVADKIWPAVAEVLADQVGYRHRCEPLSKSLHQWKGGAVAADLVDLHFAADKGPYRVESDSLIRAEEFAEYLEATTPLSTSCVKEILAEGLDRGLPHRYFAGEIYFDQIDSWNWLYDHEPRFFESDYRVLEGKRRRSLVVKGGRLQTRHEWRSYRIDYRIQIPVGCLDPGQLLRVNLPFPIEKPGHQQDVKILECKPASMRGVLASSMGFFYGYEVEVAGELPELELSYRCELSVRALAREVELGPMELEEEEYAEYTQIEDKLLLRPEVILARYQWSHIDGVEDKARAIYESIACQKRFKKTRDRSQSLTYSTLAVLSDTGGHCTTLTRAFISLCRAEGIAAREAVGALVGYPEGEHRFSMQGRSEGLYGHAWAEIHVPGKGWLPVEFHGVVIGPQAMTEDNVADASLRTAIQTDGPKYLDYYFGNLDNQRILFAPSAKKIPLFQVKSTDESSMGGTGWKWPEGLCFNTHLKVECL